MKPETIEEALAAVKQRGGSLCWVPDELKTPELCLAAVFNAVG